MECEYIFCIIFFNIFFMFGENKREKVLEQFDNIEQTRMKPDGKRFLFI